MFVKQRDRGIWQMVNVIVTKVMHHRLSIIRVLVSKVFN
ncbi:unnamed protein product [Wuchereria bancrofti]|uniref:Uncharacterized protein n=1 Tax=Wuchereria bancrofti TaxID=6293 RepID=A0A3P7E5S0_WUCBA|nr:unnamed protein product [Wuchereria bancrofti]